MFAPSSLAAQVLRWADSYTTSRWIAPIDRIARYAASIWWRPMNTETRRIYTLILFHRQGGQCCYCRRFMTISYEPRERRRPQAATLEHLRRRADGGKDHRDNFAVACKKCNDSRGRHDWLFYASLKRDEF